MSYMIGKKIGMTQVFDEEGRVVPVTVVEAGPLTVVQKKTKEVDGYNSLKLGFLSVKEKSLNKPDLGQFKKADTEPKKVLKEYRTNDVDSYELGGEIKVNDMFNDGDIVDVSGISKGKGFQGNIKRWNQSRGPETHGSHYHRRPGAMAACADPARVFKGKKLPGHMGLEKVTVQNLRVERVDSDKNVLLIKGAVPGPKGGICVIKSAVSAKQ